MAEKAVVGFGERLHIENDSVLFDGWWHSALRISPDTFALRDEDPPEPDATFLADLAARLDAKGLRRVPIDTTLLTVITYTSLDLGGVEWQVWSTDQATAEVDLAFRASRDAFFGDTTARPPTSSNFAATMGGLRRTAGLPPMVVLTVGVDGAAVDTLAATLGTCRVESRSLSDIEPEGCQALSPNLILVDCTKPQGAEFLGRLRATGEDQLLMVAALSSGWLEGADVTLDPASSPSEWAEHLQNLLP